MGYEILVGALFGVGGYLVTKGTVSIAIGLIRCKRLAKKQTAREQVRKQAVQDFVRRESWDK